MSARALAALGLVLGSGCLLDGEYKVWLSPVPEARADGWPVGTPEEVGLDPAVLEALHRTLLRPDRHFGALAFLVVKDGRLVFEAPLRRREDLTSLHHLQSVTKSVTSLVYGLGRERGWAPGLDTTLCSVLEEACAGLEPGKRAITFRHLLTMRSGLDFPEVDFSRELWVGQPADPVRYILEKPQRVPAGTEFRYQDCDTQLVGYALQRLGGAPERVLAARHLFAPLGIEDFSWDSGAQGESMAAHGLHLKPRDLARLGQLALDGGRWQGVQVVPEAWVAEATASHGPSDDPRYGYGYFWYLVPEVGPGAFSAWGHGGQFVLVVPSKRLVLVEVALPDTTYLHGNALGDFVELTRPLWE